MAITWRNIDSPDFRGAQAGIESASRMIGGALGSLGQMANQQRQFNINEEQMQRQTVLEGLERTKDIDTNAALDQIIGITDMSAYEKTDLRDILSKNINADRKAVRDAFLAQEKRIRERQELTPNQRLEWDLGRDIINSEFQAQLDALNMQKQQVVDTIPIDETLTPTQEVSSLADVQKYINQNVSDEWKWFGWLGKEMDREKASKEFPKLIRQAHEEILANIPENQRSAYREINPVAAQKAVESMLMQGERINFEKLGSTYQEFYERLRKNDINRSRRNLAEQDLIQRSNALRQKQQDAQLKLLENLRGK